MRTQRGLTIDEIAERLAIGRTTAYAWTADLARPARAVAMSGGGGLPGNRAMQSKYKRLRDQAYELGRWEFPRLIEIPTFRDFICLYLCEGYKKSRNKVSVANSDREIIRLCQSWIVPMTRNTVTYWVQYHADQNLREVCSFWADTLKVSASAIRLQRKSNTMGLKARTWRSRQGVLTISVGDTQLRSRLQGWIDQLKGDWLDSRVGA